MCVREREMVMVMEKVTRHLLSGDRTLDLWTYPEATQQIGMKVPPSIAPEFDFSFRNPMGCYRCSRSLRRCRRRAAVVDWQAANFGPLPPHFLR